METYETTIGGWPVVKDYDDTKDGHIWDRED